MHKTFAVIAFVVLTFISANAQYEVAFSNSYPPYQFMNEEGELVGFNIDILNAIKDLYKSDIHISGGAWEAINQALENSGTQAVGGVNYPGSPDNDYIYTRSTINTSHSFLYNTQFHSRFSLERFRSLKEPLVALWEHDVLIHYVRSINPSVKFLFVTDYEQLSAALDRADVTCAFAQRVAGIYQAKIQAKDYVSALDHHILERGMGFKVLKTAPELAALLNNGLEVILANGEYQKIYDKWITEYDQSHNEWQKYYKYTVIASTIILILFLLLLIVNRILKARVRSRTKDLQYQLDLNSQIMKELKRQKIRAEESEKMKTAFLANMSHEIRTPMNGILGFTELLKTEEYLSEEQLHFINVIEQSGNRMLGTINNIIDVSKLESGVEEPSYNAVNIKGILMQLQSFFTQETKVKGIKLNVAEKGVISTKGFVTDEYKLNSILTNLIKNGIKFTRQGYVAVTYSVNQECAEFWVEDTGIGIALSQQADIFDQFVQADTSYSRNFEGSGLGLSITKGYVNLLGGEITIESEPKKGTTFYVRIPNHKL
ncbi:ATP-binding protein [Saccharicrinis sp. GN24d3]|uniref:ATP-binding protein n=1 Tax=Saccharicrinis sp. GN24d3 TaxID=3458416 RepID=UPI004035E1ED